MRLVGDTPLSESMSINGKKPVAEGIECFSADWTTPQAEVLKSAFATAHLDCKYISEDYFQNGIIIGGSTITILVGRQPTAK